MAAPAECCMAPVLKVPEITVTYITPTTVKYGESTDRRESESALMGGRCQQAIVSCGFTHDIAIRHMAYRHVLAAVDLSEESTQVLEKARSQAEQSGARLSVVTVVKPLTQVYGGIDMAPLAGSTVSFEEQAMEQGEKQLRELAGHYGVTPEDVHAVLGSPAHDIRELASRLDVDLIVIGTHGRHGLGLLLGSTASAVLHGVERDVLAVRVHVED